MPPLLVAILIFPLAGAGFLVGPMVFRFRKLQVLRNGRVSTATITSVGKTSVRVNNESQYLIHLMRAGDGTRMTKRACFKGEIALSMRKWRDGEPVKILFLPDKPNRFLLPESWTE